MPGARDTAMNEKDKILAPVELILWGVCKYIK